VYYVDSGAEEMSAVVSETTVESTHPGNVINTLLQLAFILLVL